jgi:hypothetical protein
MRESLPRINPVDRPIDQDLEVTIERLTGLAEKMGPDHIPPQEIRIKRTITPRALEKMAALPFEVLLTEHDAGTTLRTGTQFGVSPVVPSEKERRGRDLMQARYTIHNHHFEFIPIPSTFAGGDLDFSRGGRSDIDIVMGREGVSLFKLTQDDNVYENLRVLSPSLLIAKLRGRDHQLKYEIKNGYIQCYIPWTDKENVQTICEYINGTGEWKEYKKKLT